MHQHPNTRTGQAPPPPTRAPGRHLAKHNSNTGHGAHQISTARQSSDLHLSSLSKCWKRVSSLHNLFLDGGTDCLPFFFEAGLLHSFFCTGEGIVFFLLNQVFTAFCCTGEGILFSSFLNEVRTVFSLHGASDSPFFYFEPGLDRFLQQTSCETRFLELTRGEPEFQHFTRILGSRRNLLVIIMIIS